ncbi:L-type lectin-domain containing receptor kinase IV.3-like [Cryptomeria japonica]|uniref:L-type lectin-domain containing receptor kinase IV.3-like n=1 Tax=Cryptomeria japonica TaxID=3369 RepID=UPI0027DA30FE|nr:L-type lectin-domain containing receptor kinase IV.3-like [Cryptomeria japonica]
MVPQARSDGDNGLCFVMTPTPLLNDAIASQYLGLINFSSNGKDYNHIFSIEFDTIQSVGMEDKDNNHVGIDLNGVRSVVAEVAGIWEGNSLTPINLKSGNNIRAWIDYNGYSKQLEISIAAVGEGFRDDNLLSYGSFGWVYRGTLSSGEQVAVKCIYRDCTEGMKEFTTEISSLGWLQHQNLVPLRGWCRKHKRLFIIYDYMSNGNLERNLHGLELNLTWAQRYKILIDVAAGLLYLHEQWEKCVVHTDIKSSNVLLDCDLNGRVGDFGLARLYDHSEKHQTTHVVGTLGYIAPELIHSGKASPSTYVFSFGALLLEIACGRKPVDAQGVILVEWVWDLYANKRLLDTIDQRLDGDYDKGKAEIVLVLGLVCSNPNPQERLSIRQVLQVLCSKATLPGDHL